MEVQFHKDGILPWNGHAMRTHQPEYMLMLYYPQDTPEDLGPTEILPCTQYFHNDSTPENGYPLAGRTIGGGVSSEPDFARRDANRAAVLKQVGWPAETTPKKVIVPKGSVAFTHFDVYHRGTRRNPELPDDAQTRLMVSNDAPSYNLQRMPARHTCTVHTAETRCAPLEQVKFWFVRTQDNTAPTWDHRPAAVRKKRPFLRPFYIKTIILPRQARDKHREKLQKEVRFCRMTTRL